jgi:alpha-glucosidase
MKLFDKYFHPENFVFANRFDGQTLWVAHRGFSLCSRNGPGIRCLEVRHDHLWPHDYRCESFDIPPGGPAGDGGRETVHISPSAGMHLLSDTGEKILYAADGAWFGISGQSWLFRFQLRPGMQFYGLGEKHTPFERSNRRYQFRNTDVWADHPAHRVVHGDYDPDYLSVPYLIIKQDNSYIGLLLDTPYPSQIALAGAPETPAGQLDVALGQAPAILMGAQNGPAALYMITGPSLAELTRTFQKLVGPTPLPPMWALGYHQCRWGYKGHADLMHLADHFDRLGFPADGLWLDIDYLDQYRMFTFNRDHLPHPEQTTAALQRRGYRVIPILDPGIKRESGYAVYESGQAEGVFCRNPAGTPFTGIVWPGLTVFPDFSLPGARSWWGRHVKTMLEAGFGGFWLDMNEPSTGFVDDQAMRFAQGAIDHDAYHNQYALLMARATRAAMLEARPAQRPFLLSRAGCTGSQRYCAHWTGDNYSTYGHLHRAIGKSVNLALSGIPFNGPDMGGFGGDCDAALIVDWFKAAFLFPFFRNHTMHGSRPQEPWAYAKDVTELLRHYIRLRYRLLPYLYNLFIDQEERGEAILRPLFYDFEDTPELPLALIDDQFMIGPDLMQAPFVHEKRGYREVTLPKALWFRADTGAWLQGGRRLRVRRDQRSTPLFIRAGGLIPFQQEVPTTNDCDLNRIGLLCCLPLAFTGQARGQYRADDGISLEYRQGRRTLVEITARVDGNDLYLAVRTHSDGFGQVEFTPYTFALFKNVYLKSDGVPKALRPVKTSMQLTGRPLSCYRWIIEF